MKAAMSGGFRITCEWCNEQASVPKAWMDFCAPCAQWAFDHGRCRLCEAPVVIVPNPAGNPNRFFIHDNGNHCEGERIPGEGS